MRSFATPVSTFAALALPLAVAAQGYPVMADPMAPGVPPGGVIGAPAMGVPAIGAPAVGAPVGGAPYGGGAVVVSPGQQLQGGYVITPQNSWGTGCFEIARLMSNLDGRDGTTMRRGPSGPRRMAQCWNSGRERVLRRCFPQDDAGTARCRS